MGNMGFGVRPDGSPILPVYDMMNGDDPRRHGLYMDRRTRRFLERFGKTEDYDPHSLTLLEAGMYDGLGTLLPLGAYWYDLVTSSSINMFSIGRCFDVFSAERLKENDPALRVYQRIFQLHRYSDSMAAYEDYVKDRQSPKYKKVKYSLPDKMYYSVGQGVREVGKPVKETVATLDWEVWKAHENLDPQPRYFYHPGSDSVFVVQPEDSLDFLNTDDFDELSYEKYCSRLNNVEKDNAEDMEFDEPDPFDIL